MGDDEPVAVIIEDDADIRGLLEEVLSQAGFRTVTSGNGIDGVEAVREHAPTVVTLDVSLPGIDGFETAKRIREFSDTYIVMLTARTEEIDALQGLESGADDYVAKPFRPREFRARIAAMLRRPRALGQPADDLEPTQPLSPTIVEAAGVGAAADVVGETVGAGAPALTVEHPPFDPALAEPTTDAVPLSDDETTGWIEHRGLRLHPQIRVVSVDGEPVELTRTEFDLLAMLLESGRRVRSKTDLALALHGQQPADDAFVSDADRRAVEVHLANLRRKLGEAAADPRWIETVRGVGYRLTAVDA
ncbi:response regulator transcription factor [Agromyces seonyuensis]|uniref:Response regulator n=1 Tax=Agromyces seonyuensis TaxID=2662446 RepID=A0A6I4NWC4_9MICO|nr:response regulator transcription factor [Agromyces seonyuensis]MWB98746.1 response regulator [Agromyces seonyuensis]